MERVVVDFTPKFRELTPKEALRVEDGLIRLPEIRLEVAEMKKKLAERTRRMFREDPSALYFPLR